MSRDNRRIVQISGQPNTANINEALRQLSQQIRGLQGRHGPVRMRETLELFPQSENAIKIKPESGYGNGTIVAKGDTTGSDLTLAVGAEMVDGVWVATAPEAAIVTVSPTDGVVVTTTTALTPGQPVAGGGGTSVSGSVIGGRGYAIIYDGAGNFIAGAGALTSVSWQNVITQNPNTIWTVASPTIINIPYDGLYLISVKLQWQAVGGGTIRRLALLDIIKQNPPLYAGAKEIDTHEDSGGFPAGVGITMQGAVIRNYTAGDSFLVQVSQNSGGVITIGGGFDDAVCIKWLGPVV